MLYPEIARPEWFAAFGGDRTVHNNRMCSRIWAYRRLILVFRVTEKARSEGEIRNLALIHAGAREALSPAETRDGYKKWFATRFNMCA